MINDLEVIELEKKLKALSLTSLKARRIEEILIATRS